MSDVGQPQHHCGRKQAQLQGRRSPVSWRGDHIGFPQTAGKRGGQIRTSHLGPWKGTGRCPPGLRRSSDRNSSHGGQGAPGSPNTRWELSIVTLNRLILEINLYGEMLSCIPKEASLLNRQATSICFQRQIRIGCREYHSRVPSSWENLYTEGVEIEAVIRRELDKLQRAKTVVTISLGVRRRHISGIASQRGLQARQRRSLLVEGRSTGSPTWSSSSRWGLLANLARFALPS